MSNLGLRFPPGVDRQIFLDRIWQQQPLLMPAGLSQYDSPLDPDDLAGLACEESVESRIVLERGSTPWEVRSGPFEAADLARLPGDRPWTLLVQDVDKHVPEVARLLTAFDFLPAWRIDDVMVSFANPGGSVGPHIDQYDVFLLQVSGRRRWRYCTAAPETTALRPDTALRILADLHPDVDVVLEPGDLLYLPPGLPHWGVALEDCMTFSIGFHAPAYSEMLADWCDRLLERIDPQAHYRDPPIDHDAEPGLISDAAFERAERILEELSASSRGERRRWFGRLITQGKPHLAVEGRERELDASSLTRRFAADNPLRRHPFARFAFGDLDRARTVLFVDGQAYELPSRLRGFVLALVRDPLLHFGRVSDWLDYPECGELIARLYNRGCLSFDDDTD